MILVLVAPPAFGKTRFLKSLFDINNKVTGLYLSPLRALKEEFEIQVKDLPISVLTCEQYLLNSNLELNNFDYLILDEAHLWWSWGNTFRPQMWEAFYQAHLKSRLTIFLTATLSLELFNDLYFMQNQGVKIDIVNYGNFNFKNEPQYLNIFSKNFLEQFLLTRAFASHDKFIIFCKYRKEVEGWRAKLLQLGKNVLTCVGGEAYDFSQKLSGLLKKNIEVDVIVATHVLSHGVNLPQVDFVAITYEESDPIFWLQMSTRAGRRGESFQIYAVNQPFDLKYNKRWIIRFVNFLTVKWNYFLLSFQDEFRGYRFK